MKGKRKLMKEREMFRVFTIKCFENAQQFVQDSEVLCSHQSYGHVYTLLILGFEEWAKTMSGFIFFSGGLDLSDRSFRNLWRNHTWKQRIAHVFVFALFGEIAVRESPLQPEYYKLYQTLQMGKIDEKTYVEQLRELMQKNSSPTAQEAVQIWRFLDELTANPRLIEAQKQAGFYVEYHWKDFSTTSPQRTESCSHIVFNAIQI